MESSEQTFGFNRSDANELVRMIGMSHREHLDPRPRQRRGGGGADGGMIEFQFDDDILYDEPVPADCSDRTKDGYNFRVKVINTTCRGGVLGMDEDGYVTVSDPGYFLIRRDPRDLPGRTGFAQLMNAESDYGEPCGWVITWINFFRETIVVHDVIFQENKILLKRKKIVVWDSCNLTPEEIAGADCDPEDEYI